jgi:hypothetical protein
MGMIKNKKMDNRQLLASWAQHDVYKGNNPRYIFKLPKANSTLLTVHISEIQKYCSFLQKYFWKFMPRTRIISYIWWYAVVQERINGRILREIDPQMLSNDTLEQLMELINIWHHIAVENLFDIDVFWQHADDMMKIEKKFEGITQYLDAMIASGSQRIVPKILLRMLSIIRYVNHHYISHFYVHRDFFSSSNIMIDKNWWVFFVDNAWLLGKFWIQKQGLRNFEISYRKMMLRKYQNQVSSIMKYRK